MKKDLASKARKATESMTGISTQSEQAFDAQAKKTTKRNKPANDFIRLDLRPQGNDLKSYVVKQANKESIRRKEQISATRYIQELIEKDKELNDGKRKNTTADELKSRIDRMNRKQQAIFLEMFDLFDI